MHLSYYIKDENRNQANELICQLAWQNPNYGRDIMPGEELEEKDAQ
jgi:hypothetical protein